MTQDGFIDGADPAALPEVLRTAAQIRKQGLLWITPNEVAAGLIPREELDEEAHQTSPKPDADQKVEGPDA
ncbi:MAG: hypothetical protein AABM43_12135 [Actinomycetota bacterium]